MKIKLFSLFTSLVLFAAVSQALAQGTAFTYQGQLQNNGSPANGAYDLQFILFNTNQFGFPVGPILTNSSIVVSEGLFTTTLDFGPVFTGSAYWLEIGVRSNGNGAFATLAPRQPVSPTPYAIAAEGLAGVLANNTIQNGALSATISGGGGNVIQSNANNSVIGGGGLNTIQIGADHSTIAGGNADQIQSGAFESFIGGGQGNIIKTNATWAVISGGLNNSIQTNASYSAIGGGWYNNLYSHYCFIGGGYDNVIQSNSGSSIIGAGYANLIQTNSPASTIGGGEQNVIQFNAGYSTIGGGYDNMIQTNALFSSIVGGYQNIIQSSYSFVGGGAANVIRPNVGSAAITGGDNNIIQSNGVESVIGGGASNTNNGPYSVIPGGLQNLAAGSFSFAAGQNAHANYSGSFVWADDSTTTPFGDTAPNQFCLRAAGGVSILVSGSSGLNPPAVSINSTSGNGIGLLVNQNSSDTSALFANGGTGDIIKGFSGVGNTVFEVSNDGTVRSKGMALSSDRNAKEHFKPLDDRAILDKVISLPLSEWNYKSDSSDQKHIGPMAQDFHAAFALNGSDETHISVVDEGGVALAAIQGLNQKLEITRAESKAKDAEIQDLQRNVAELRKMLESLAGKK